MSTQNSKVTYKNLAEVLTSTIKIPDFQRKFSWDQNLISRFIDTLLIDFDKEKEMYLGDLQIMSVKDENVIIDGQQRLTTIFLVLLFLANKWREISEKSYPDLQDLLYKEQLEVIHDKEIFYKKLKLSNQYGPYETFLSEIKEKYLNPNEYNAIAVLTKKALKENANLYEIGLSNIKGIFEAKFSRLEPKTSIKLFINTFVQYIRVNIKFTVVEETNINTALSIFTRKNMIGKPLTQVENLKVLMMSKIQSEKNRDIFTSKWNDIFTNFNKLLTNNRSNQEDNHSTNLIHWTLSTFQVKSSKSNLLKVRDFEGDLFRHMIEFIEWDDYAMTQFVEALEETFSIIKSMLASDRSTILQNMTSGGYTWYPLIISGFKLYKSEKEREIVYRIAEHLMTFLILKNKSIGGTYAVKDNFRKVLESLLLKTSLEDIYEKVKIDYNIYDLKNEIIGLKYKIRGIGKRHSTLMKNILLHIEANTQSILKSDPKFAYTKYKELLNQKNFLEVEHILPTSDAACKLDEDIETIYNSIGNLTFLEKNKNSAISNKAFDIKSEIYIGSIYEITKMLCGMSHITKTDTKKHFSKYFTMKDTFDLGDVKNRSENLADLYIDIIYRPI